MKLFLVRPKKKGLCQLSQIQCARQLYLQMISSQFITFHVFQATSFFLFPIAFYHLCSYCLRAYFFRTIQQHFSQNFFPSFKCTKKMHARPQLGHDASLCKDPPGTCLESCVRLAIRDYCPSPSPNKKSIKRKKTHKIVKSYHLAPVVIFTKELSKHAFLSTSLYFGKTCIIFS